MTKERGKRGEKESMDMLGVQKEEGEYENERMEFSSTEYAKSIQQAKPHGVSACDCGTDDRRLNISHWILGSTSHDINVNTQ